MVNSRSLSIKKKRTMKVVAATFLLLSCIKLNETYVNKRRWWVRPWLKRNEGNLELINDQFPRVEPDQLKKFLRMNQTAFDKLLQLITPLIRKQTTNMREAISPKDKLSITLRFLATGETYRSLMYSFRVHESTISLFVPEVCDAIYSVLQNEYLKVPQTAADWLNIAEEFDKFWNFPNVLGALDGKHILFRASRKDGSAFQNYKNSQSIVLMALVDANYNFRYIDVGCNGRVSDGGVFLNSTLYKAIYDEENILNLPEERALPGRNTPVPFVIIGDGAFALSDRLIKHFPLRNMTEEQRVFNYRLSRARRVVENAFGHLANRFRVLLTTINLHKSKVRKIVKACCVLHNYLKKECPQFHTQELDDHYVFRFAFARQKGNRCKESAKNIREEFMHYVNNEGSVPWQNNLNLMF